MPGEQDLRCWLTGKMLLLVVVISIVLFVALFVGTVPIITNIIYVQTRQSVPCRLLSKTVVSSAASDVRCYSDEECAAIRCTVDSGGQISAGRPIYWAELDFWPRRRVFQSVGSHSQMEQVATSDDGHLQIGSEYACLLTEEGISHNLVFLVDGTTWTPWNFWLTFALCLVLLVALIVPLVLVAIFWIPPMRKIRQLFDHRDLIAPHRVDGSMMLALPTRLPSLPSFSRSNNGQTGSSSSASATRSQRTPSRVEPSGHVLGRD